MTESAKVIRRRREKLALRQGYVALLARGIFIALAAYLLLTQVFLLAQASGMGMFPAVKDGDLLIAYRLQKDYRKNDVVLFQAEGTRQLGRLLAQEGDYISMDADGVLRINGTVQAGEILYPTYPREGEEFSQQVPEGCVYILCDHRTDCRDSRDFGPVPWTQVEAKVITVLRRRTL